MTSNQTMGGPTPSGDRPGFARIERMFSNLAALVKARAERRAPLESQTAPRRQSRSEAFRQVQREKWLGVRTPTVIEAQPRAPKDLHKRILQDPNE